MEKRKIRNIIIRNLTDEQREHILSAMRDTGHATASQALMAVCEGYSRMALLCRSPVRCEVVLPLLSQSGYPSGWRMADMNW